LLQLWLIGQMGPASATFTFDIGVPTFLAAVVLGTASSIVGVLIVARQPTNAVGWIYVITGVAEGLATAGLAYAALVVPTRPDAIATFFVWWNGVVDFTVPFSFAAVVLALFPDGRLVAPRWRWVIVIAFVGSLVRLAEVGFGEPSMVLLAGSVNPFRVEGAIGDALQRSSAAGLGSILVEASFLLAAASLAARYRLATPDGRRQIRWIVVAGFVAVLGTIPLLLAVFSPGTLPVGFDVVGVLFVALTLSPIATLIAITRYRLYEIDRIVNRALLYGSLTAILAGVFTAGISLAQRLFVAMTGESSDAAIVLTTLVVATTYAPLRKRLEAVVDRRFKYENAQFGAYRAEVGRILSIVDPELAAQRLIAEAVSELDATGGAVLAADGSVTATAGAWPQDFVDRVAVPGDAATTAALAIGPRSDGRPHDPARLEELGRVAGMVARASRSRPAAH
jgi:hypothetical protein